MAVIRANIFDLLEAGSGQSFDPAALEENVFDVLDVDVGDPTEAVAPPPEDIALEPSSDASVPSEDEREHFERLRLAFKHTIAASLPPEELKEVARRAARELNRGRDPAGHLINPSFIEANYQEIASTWLAANFDPERWEAENPDLARIVRRRPDLAGVAATDKEAGRLAKAIGWIADQGLTFMGGAARGTATVVDALAHFQANNFSSFLSEQAIRLFLSEETKAALPDTLLPRAMPSGRHPVASGLEAFGGSLLEARTEETKRAAAGSQASGDIRDRSTWSLGEDPSLWGYWINTVEVFGGMTPIFAAGAATGGVGAAVVGGLQSGGEGVNEARDLIRTMAETMVSDGDGGFVSLLEKESAFYRELREKGWEHEDAVRLTAERAGSLAFFARAPVGAAGGFVSGKVLGVGGRFFPNASPLRRFVGNVAIGTGEEFVTEPSETVLGRTAIALGASMDLALVEPWEGTFGDAFMGGLAGGKTAVVGGIPELRFQQAKARWEKQKAQWERSLGAGEHSANQIQLIRAFAATRLGKEAPDAIARVVREQTAVRGEEVNEVHLDPEATLRLFQEEQTSTEEIIALLGEDAMEQLQEAQATGGRVAIPLETFVTWGDKPLAEKLVPHLSTGPARMTQAQLATERDAIDAEAKELARRFEQEDVPAESGAETSFLATLEKQLAATGIHDKGEARKATALWRAFVRVQSERFGVEPDVLFDAYRVRVEGPQTQATEGEGQVAAQSAALAVEPEAPPASGETASPNEGPAPGTPLANGFLAGHEPGRRYRVSEITSTGALMLEFRSDITGRGWNFYVTKDGSLLPDTQLVLNQDYENILWLTKDADPSAVARVKQLLHELGKRDIDDPQRESIKAEIKAVVQGKEAPSAPAPSSAPGAGPGTPGATTTVITPQRPQGERAHYRVIEADDLIPSHREDNFQARDDYPAGVQEREYHRQPEEQVKVATGAQTLNPALLLADSPTAIDGPPLVTAGDRALVMGGNGRAMMIKRAFKDPAKAQAYREALKAKAQAFGIDPAAIDGMKAPVLVRVLEDVPSDAPQADLVAAVRRTNESMTQALSPQARAVAEAKTLSPSTVEAIANVLAENPDDTLRSIMAKRPRELVAILRRDGVITNQNQSSWLRGHELTDEAKDRLEGMFLGRVVGSGDRMAQTPKAILAKLERIAPSLMRVQGINPAADATALVQQALDIINEANQRNLPIEALTAQTSLIPGEGAYEPEAVRMADLIQRSRPLELAARFRAWANLAAFDPNQVQMFGTNPAPAETRAALLSDTLVMRQNQDALVLYQGPPPPESVQAIREDAAKEGVKLDIHDRGDVIVVPRMVVPEGSRSQGIGTSIMERIVAFADATGKTVALTPSTDFGATSKARLTSFYKRFGFVENKGRARDHEISEAMYRAPRRYQAQREGLAPPIEAAERPAATFKEAREAAKAFQGKPLENDSTDIKAVLGRNRLDKMLNGKAVGKSSSPQLQALAVANADHLFKRAVLGWSKPDRNNDQNVKAIHRFFAPMLSPDGKALLAKLTVKETAIEADPNPLYTIEAVELNEASPAATWVAATAESDGIDPTSTRSAGDVLNLAQQVEAFNSPQTRQEQAAPKGKEPRGFMERKGNDFRIVLGKKADLSTFLHETGHVFLEILGDLAQRPDAPQQVREDYQRLLAWFGVADRSEIQTEHHEKFARGFEAYLREGKAPSDGLAGAFDSFGRWLKRIYRSIRGLDVELSSEVRGVFDRLIATDEEIARARDESGQTIEMFPDREAAKMSEQEWADYQKLRGEPFKRSERAARRKALEETLRAKKKAWREERAKLRKEAEEAYGKTPAFRAKAALEGKMIGEDGTLLSEGAPVRLDRAAVVEAVGEQRARRFLTEEEGGVHPDELAEMYGFTSGAEMMQAIDALPSRRDWAREQADAQMDERHPGMLQDLERLREEIQQLAHRGGLLNLILFERDVLRRLSGRQDKGPSAEVIERAAEMILERRTVGRLRPGMVLHQERMAAHNAAMALKKGDFARAEREKERQAVNAALYRRMMDAREEMRAARDDLRRRTRREYRAELGKASEDYLVVHDAVLAAVGIGDQEVDTVEALAALDRAVQLAADDANPFVFDVDEIRRLIVAPVRWPDLSLTNARNVRDAVVNIREVARAANEITLEGKRVQLADAIAQLKQDAEALPDFGKAPASRQQVGRARRAFDFAVGLYGQVIQPERLMESLGTIGRQVFERFKEANRDRNRLLREVIEPINAVWEKMPKSTREKRWQVIPELDKLLPLPPDANLAGPRDQMHLIMIALNMGNESNKDRLLNSMRWTEEQVMAVLNDRLSAEEWQWVQSIFDILDGKLWPEVAAKEKRRTGLAPEKIEASPLVTKHGTFRGGYFPAVYDPRASGMVGERQAEDKISGLFGPGYTRPATQRGHTKERVKDYSNILFLDWSVVPAHLLQVVHDIAFDEFVRDSARLFLNQEVRETFERRLGVNRAIEPKEWLRYVANSWAASAAQANSWWAKLSGVFKNRAVLGALGYSATVAMSDFANAFTAMAVGRKRGGTSFTFGLPAYLAALPGVGRLAGVRQMALRKSPELRDRLTAFSNERRLRYLRDIGRKRGKLTATIEQVANSAWFFQEQMDKMVSTQLWLARYWEEKARGTSEAEAVRLADAVVRKHLMSPERAEQSRLIRDPGAVSAIMAFQGYANVLLNIVSGLGGGAVRSIVAAQRGTGTYREAALELAMTAGRIQAVIFFGNVLPELFAGRGPDEDEEWEEWILRKQIGGYAYITPVVGVDAEAAIQSAIRGKRMPTSGRAVGMSYLFDQFQNIGTLANGDAEDERRAWAAIELMLSGAGLPHVQPRRTFGYVQQLLNDEADAENVFDIMSGLLYGHRENQPANPFSAMSDAMEGR